MKKAKEYNARGERMYENAIKRENAKKNKKNKINKMKKAKASVGAVPTQVEIFKTGILKKENMGSGKQVGRVC